jgi:hypothetical protein
MASRAMLGLVDGGGEQRRADRVRLLLTARLVTTTDEYPVMLRDISLTGAMVEGSRLPGMGVDLLLKRGALEIFAQVVWVDGRRAGLEFEPPLGATEFATQFPRTVWASRRPADAPPASEPMSLAEWEAAQNLDDAGGCRIYRD